MESECHRAFRHAFESIKERHEAEENLKAQYRARTAGATGSADAEKEAAFMANDQLRNYSFDPQLYGEVKRVLRGESLHELQVQANDEDIDELVDEDEDEDEAHSGEDGRRGGADESEGDGEDAQEGESDGNPDFENLMR